MSELSRKHRSNSRVNRNDDRFFCCVGSKRVHRFSSPQYEKETMKMRTTEIQKRIYENKKDKGWNVTSIEKELCLLQGELAEFYEAYRKQLPTVGEELADVAIYLLGIAEIIQVDLGEEVERKTRINALRQYADINGVNTRIVEATNEGEQPRD